MPAADSPYGTVAIREPLLSLWRRAALWLLCLAPFFYLTYGFANWFTSTRTDVGTFVFAWERYIPFVPWTILPYWSINLLYGLSFFICTSRAEIDRHGKRLLTAQVIAVVCFLLFPLRFTFPVPETSGWTGLLFDLLGSFDKPFNEAPSLHIAILVLLWRLYANHTPRRWHWFLHPWFVAIGLSVLTTYQHHVIDIPTGAALGLFSLWLWPEHFTPPWRARLTACARRRRIAAGYGAGAVLFGVLATILTALAKVFFVLWWPALSLGLVAWNYAFIGAAGFQKYPDGRHRLAAAILFAPYTLAALVNAWAWTRRNRAPTRIAGNVSLGPLPRPGEWQPGRFSALLDMTAELPWRVRDDHLRYRTLPSLDLVSESADILREAVTFLDANPTGETLVSCALGVSRSAAVVTAWLVAAGHAPDTITAIAILRKARPRIVLKPAQIAAIEDAVVSMRAGRRTP